MAQSVGRGGGGGGGGRVIGEYSVGKQIGSGSFSVVWHARHRVHGTEVAIKEISMARLNKKLQESLLSEIVILKQINHPNIIRLHDIIEVPGKIHLVLEYCRGGDLFMHIQRHGRVTEATAKHFMQQLAAGLLVLRKNDLIHRDLKPQNLLLSTNDNNSVLKIADFGFARSLQPRGLAETLCGSPLYMAPEIMQLQKYDAKADLWSVGTILFQLVTGRTPFTGNNQMQLLQNIIKSTELRFPPEIKNLSSECIDLCRKLLRRNPVERLTFDEFFNHTFLSTKLPDEKLKSKKPSQSTEIFPLSECHNLENRVQSSQEDCLPFLFDDDSSGPDGSPPFAGRRSSMKPLRGFALEPRREMLSNSMKNVDAVSQDGNVINEMERCGFRLDNDKTRQPSTKMDYRPGNPCSRVMDSLEFIDQEYVIVSGPPLDGSSTTTSISKPHLSPSPFPASVDVNSICSVPMTIGCPVGNPCHVGSLDSQCSIPSGTSHGSMDIGDASEQTSGNSLSRIKSLQHCAAIIKELLSKKIEACRYLEAFSIQLVILAIWKQALDIYHTQAVSSVEVSSTQDSARIKASMDCKISSPGVHGCFDGFNSKLLDDIFFEIKAEFFEDVEYAEELSKFIEPGNTEMPDAMETIYQAALSLGRSGAVDELMENMESAVSSYSKAVRLLVFLLVEAPSLLLNPPFSLTNSDRFRLRNYINILNDRQGHSRSQRMNLFKPEDQQCKTLR